MASHLTHIAHSSYLPWFEVFYKFLNNLADYITKGQVGPHSGRVSFSPQGRSKVNSLSIYVQQIKEMKLLLAALYKQSVPLVAGSLTLQMVSLGHPPLPHVSPMDPSHPSTPHTHSCIQLADLTTLWRDVLLLSEGEQLLVSTQVSRQGGHPEGGELVRDPCGGAVQNNP